MTLTTFSLLLSLACSQATEIDYRQKADALSISCPGEMPFKHAVGFKIVFQQEQ